MKKSILILKASKDICGNEIGLITNHCQLLDIKVVSEEVKSEEHLESVIEKYSALNSPFDYLYLCSHGNKDGFEANMGAETRIIKWSKFSQIICESGILKDDTILLLACCKGGLFQVASDILTVCNKINFVCGVKWNVAAWDLTTGFIVFIHNIEIKNAEPTYAAQKASQATDFTFVCYDRDEAEMNPAYQNRRVELFIEIGWMNDKGEWTEENERIKENVGIG